MNVQQRVSALRTDDSWRDAVIGSAVALAIIVFETIASGEFETLVAFSTATGPVLLGGALAGYLSAERPGVAGRRVGLIAIAPAALWMIGDHVAFLVRGDFYPIWMYAVGAVFFAAVVVLGVAVTMLVGKIGGLVGAWIA